MKILVVSDYESKSLWDYYQPEKLKDVDFILSCGDLDPEYLSFLVTMTNQPLFYVQGNHDSGYETHPPEGCVCIEDKVVVYKGVRILGLGGSYRYKPGNNQYTEKEMMLRAWKVGPQIRRRGGFDILLTHAPAFGHNDLSDLPHRGFHTFGRLIEKYKPKYFVHGHVHMNYGAKIPRTSKLGETTVINGYEAWLFEF